MKRHVGVLLSTISAAALTTASGGPTAATKAPADGDRAPIERLDSIRSAYLATLAGETKWNLPIGDQVAQFQNFPNFPNFSNWRNQ
jgi:hypothetical protein